MIIIFVVDTYNTPDKFLDRVTIYFLIIGRGQGPKKGLTDARSAVGFCLGSGLFGSYNSD